jgi:DNA-binding XRE family transcriptional regulator
MNDIYWTREATRQARTLRPDRIMALECAACPLMRVPEHGSEPVSQTGPDTFELRCGEIALSFAWSFADSRVVVLACNRVDTPISCEPELDGDALIPHDVVIRVLRGASCARAWREHLRVTQLDLARRLGVSQPTLSASERTDHLRRRTVERLAHALDISEQQLVF